jgi:large subunit ribosomal protein L3
MEGEKNSHGQHEFFRHGGSIGCRKTPGRVHRGKRMTGHMGNERVTTQNMTVAKVDVETGLVLVRGPVPGGKNGYVTIRRAIKPAIRAGKNAG